MASPAAAETAARVLTPDVGPQIEAAFARETRSHWVEHLTEVGVPCGPINSIPEVFADPQVQAREMLRYLPHPTAGVVPQVMSPFKFTNARLEIETPPPLLGQHTDEVLHELGIDDARISELRGRAIV